ncbi:hypothetical protein ACSS6W_010230 [Trichoderma asperelloides]
MVLALLLPVLASGVAAQHLTLPLVDYGAVVDAVNPNDPGYQICTDVAQFVSACVVKAGGTAALSTANPVSLAECACCVGTTDVAPAYSSCANYLVSEAPQLTSQISACGASPQLCLGNSGGNSGGGGSVTEQSEPSATPKSSQPQSPPPAASTSIPSPASSPSKIPQQTSATGGGSTSPATTGSAASAVTTLAPACTSMVDIFEQLAKTFATFCQHFSDACAVTTNGPSSNTNNNPFPPPDSTGSSGNGGDGGQVTVTVTRPPPTTTSHNAAPTARAGLAAGALAIAGFAIMI